MNILLAAIGRLKSGPERELYEYYVTRAGWKIACRECELKTKSSSPARREKEAALLLNAVADSSHVVAFDERGTSISSVQFSDHIRKVRDEGAREIAFIIGGADGLHESVLKRAHLSLSFGRVTWPHMLMRVMLAEQLYRAHTILSGHPYHRE